MRTTNLLVLLGRRGAGKSTLASAIECRYAYLHYEMSAIMKRIRFENGQTERRLRDFVTMMHHKYSHSFAVKYMLQNGFFGVQDTVLTGIRNEAELAFLKEQLATHIVLPVYIWAPVLTRFRRSVTRNERAGFWEFLVEEFYSIRWGDYQLCASSVLIDNTGNVENTLSAIMSIVSDGKNP